MYLCTSYVCYILIWINQIKIKQIKSCDNIKWKSITNNSVYKLTDLIKSNNFSNKNRLLETNFVKNTSKPSTTKREPRKEQRQKNKTNTIQMYFIFGRLSKLVNK